MSAFVTQNDIGAGLQIIAGKLVVMGATTQVYVEKFAGGSSDGQQSGAWMRGATVTRTAVGRWDVVFGTAGNPQVHPDGTDYHPSLSLEEASGTRDDIIIQVVRGSKSPGGFQIQIHRGDNGQGAGTYVDRPWSFGVDCPVNVLTGIV